MHFSDHYLRLLFILLVTAFSSFAQSSMTIYGQITDDKNRPIENVQVSVSSVKYFVRSDSLGNYRINVESSASEVFISVYHTSFQPTGQEIRFKKGKSVQINFQLVPLINDADTVEIENKKRKEKRATSIDIDAKVLDNVVTPTDDGLGVVKTQAGVASNNELSSAYSVRGGNFDENLIYVNGIQVYRPFLIRAGRQEGLSFVNSDLISDISFSAGGFEAQYGDKMSSVLDITYTEPTGFKQSVNLSLLGARAHAEGKVGDFTYLTGFRYRSNAYLLGGLETEGEYRPRFMDFQGYFTYSPTEKLKLGYLTNMSSNVFEVVPQSRTTNFGGINNAFQLNVFFDGSEVSDFLASFNALSLAYTPTDKTVLKFSGSSFQTIESENFDIFGAYRLNELETNFGEDDFGEVSTFLGNGSFLDHARNELFANILSLYHDGVHFWKFGKFMWGANYNREEIDDKIMEWQYQDSADFALPLNPNAIEMPIFNQASGSLISERYTAYLQNDWSLLSDSSIAQFTLNTGVRAQYWTYNEDVLISPRVSASYVPAVRDSLGKKRPSKLAYHVAWGYYYQPPFYRDLRNIEGEIQQGLKAQRAIHYVAGVDYDFRMWDRPFTWRSEVYYKDLDNLIPYEVENVRVRYFGENSGKGYAAGVESRINGEFIKGLESWLSIAIMQTQEDIVNDSYYEYYNQSGERIRRGYTEDAVVTDSVQFFPGFMPRPTDQRFSVKAFFQDQMPKFPSFKVHLNLVYAGGVPTGPPGSVKNRNALRLPPYRRVDIGFSWYMIEDGKRNKGTRRTEISSAYLKFLNDLSFRFEVFNLLNINNTVSYLWLEDVFNRQYAIPNFLTQRLINFKVIAKF
jgi:hypothetical protein